MEFDVEKDHEIPMCHCCLQDKSSKHGDGAKR
jgi:hypothetical protein